MQKSQNYEGYCSDICMKFDGDIHELESSPLSKFSSFELHEYDNEGRLIIRISSMKHLEKSDEYKIDDTVPSVPQFGRLGCIPCTINADYIDVYV